MKPVRNQIWRYSIALGAILLAFLVFKALSRQFGANFPTFITFYPALMLVALRLGLGPGLAATALASLIADYWILPPAGRFSTSLRDLVIIALFTGIGGGITVVVEMYRRRTSELEASYAQLVKEAVERKKAEAELLQSEQRYRGIVDNQSIYVDRYLPGGILTFVNEALARVTGLAPEQLLGASFYPFLHEDDRESVIGSIEGLSAENPIVVTANRVLLPDGMHWQQWEHRALFDSDGTIVEYQSTGRDITEQRVAEHALAESERAYRAVVEDQSELITRYRTDGTYSFVNEAFCRYFGKSREEVLGRHWVPDAVPEDIPMIEARLALLSPEHPMVVIENRVISGSGEIRWIQFVNRGFFDGQGCLIDTQAVGRDITDTKKLEEVLRESEHRYSSLFANKISAIAHCTVITDERNRPVDYRILEVNEAYERIVGIKKTVIEGRTVREVFPGVENYTFDYIGSLGRVALEGGEANFETFLEPTRQYLSIYVYSPSPGEFTTIFTDITDRIQTTEALRKSESALLEAQRVAHIGSWTWDAGADTIWWSDELYRIYGKTQTAPLPSYQQDQNNYTALSAAQLTAVVQQTMQTGEPYLIDLELRADGGPKRWVQARGEAVRNRLGEIVGLRGTVQDITDRKQQEELINTYANKFRLLAESMPQIVWICSPDGLNIYFNQQWVDYTGMTLEESYGHGWNRPFHPDDRQRAWEAWQRAINYGNPYALECRLRRGDGSYKWWLIRGVPITDEKGVVVNWFGTCTDIDELKNAEESIKLYAHRLIVLEETLRQKIAVELHDNIAQVLVAADLNMKNIHQSLPKKLGNQLSPLFEQSQRLNREVISKLRTLMTELRPNLLDDLGLAEAIRYETDRCTNWFGIATDVQIDPAFDGLPVEKGVLYFRIIQEGLNNVVKHAGATKVAVSLNCNDDGIRLCINDNGRGFGLSTKKPLPTETGWGITLMRERAQLLGGEFRIDSVEGVGTSITVEIGEQP